MDFHVIMTARFRSGLSTKEDTFDGVITVDSEAPESSVYAHARVAARKRFGLSYAENLTILFYRAVPNDRNRRQNFAEDC